MQILSRLLMHTEETEEQLSLLASISIDLMTDVIGPLGYALTALPAGNSHPGKTAGPSFRFTRDGTAAPHQSSAWTLFTERMNELSAYCGILEFREPRFLPWPGSSRLSPVTPNGCLTPPSLSA